MEKAIYGMAQPFNDFYFKEDSENGIFLSQRTNRNAVRFDTKVGITLFHDYSKQLGTTEDNLLLQVTDAGIFFKLIPNTPLGLSAYKRVKRAALRHCSLSYILFEKERNSELEQAATAEFQLHGFSDQIVIEDYKKIVVYEVCLTNRPANKSTFCTTNYNDPRLEGLNWDAAAPIPETLCLLDDPELMAYKDWYVKETESLRESVSEYKKIVREAYR
ncbi:Caudovirus prohead protease [compost metagenome]